VSATVTGVPFFHGKAILPDNLQSESALSTGFDAAGGAVEHDLEILVGGQPVTACLRHLLNRDHPEPEGNRTHPTKACRDVTGGS